MRLRLPIVHSVNFWDLEYPKRIVEFARTLGKISLALICCHSTILQAKKAGTSAEKAILIIFPISSKRKLKIIEQLLMTAAPGKQPLVD